MDYFFFAISLSSLCCLFMDCENASARNNVTFYTSALQWFVKLAERTFETDLSSCDFAVSECHRKQHNKMWRKKMLSSFERN